ncbi:MAG: phosphoadenylyl-sulfate reductase [Solirubrobacteraceae bacterium]
MTAIAFQDLQDSAAEDVVGYAVERFHPRLTMACSFQKEESVLLHMLLGVCEEPRVFTIDTGVLFPETLETWKRFEDHFGVRIEVFDAQSPGEPWTINRCCSEAKVTAVNSALQDVDAWITGIRREQAATRSSAAKLERDEAHDVWKVNPLADWSEADVWRYIFRHKLPYNPLHDQGYASIGCQPCTLPGNGREGRWAGLDKTECGIHE